MSADWTDGEPRIVVSVCDAWGHRWYLRRAQCPRCGGAVSPTVAAGRGLTVATAAQGGRGPIALVDLDEGVRVLGRCDPDLRPGEPARLTFRAGADDPVAVPRFEVDSPERRTGAGRAVGYTVTPGHPVTRDETARPPRTPGPAPGGSSAPRGGWGR